LLRIEAGSSELSELEKEKETNVHSTLGLEGNRQTAHSPEEHQVTLDGARMRYRRSGSGPALLLVHGLLGYSFSWRFAMPVVARQATVYAVDMLGAGFSDRPPGLECNLRASAERLLRFLDAVGVASCDLLGASHGGAVGMMAAALAPDRVRRLILVAPANPWSARGKRLTAFLSSRVMSPLFLLLAPYFEVTHSVFLRRMFGDTRRIRPGTLQGYSAPFALAGAFEYGLGVARSWNQDLQELKLVLPRIAHIPTLLIWGSLDSAVSPASAVQLCQQFKQCCLVMLEGVGHLPYEEVPEEFNRAALEFLNGSRPGTL
jgi:pimeloyl-ACP methyl ester carboxylesterase